jgi:hypothetical protein
MNSGLAKFLAEMGMQDQAYAVVQPGQIVKGFRPVCGHVWIQGLTKMTATNPLLGEIPLGLRKELVAITGVRDELRRKPAYDSARHHLSILLSWAKHSSSHGECRVCTGVGAIAGRRSYVDGVGEATAPPC